MIIFLSKVPKQISYKNKLVWNTQHEQNRRFKNVAIACAVTSKGMENVEFANHHIIKDFLPTFCKTASEGYTYSFYIRLV